MKRLRYEFIRNIKLLERNTGNNKDDSAEQRELIDRDFMINHAYVCPSKGEITLSGQSHSVEPKVMQVLIVLSTHANDVVGAEQLFEKVWPRSIYNPTSIRRCIAVLRKVFDDKSKSLIKTHPKRGYSLQAQITINKTPPVKADQNTGYSFSTSFKATKSIWHIAILFIGFSLLYSYWAYQQSPLELRPSSVWQVSNLRPITAASETEPYAKYLVGGQQIVFVRKSTDGHSQLWLKTLDTDNEELLLSQVEQILSLEVNANKSRAPKTDKETKLTLAILANNGLNFEQITLNDTFKVIDREHLFLAKDKSWVSPFYSDNNSLYFLAEEAGTVNLYAGLKSNGKITLLLKGDEKFTPYRITKSANENAITVLGFNDKHISQVWNFSIENHRFELKKSLDANWYFIDKHPSEASYLLSNGKSLFQLNTENELILIKFENYAFLHFPSFSPDGQQLLYSQANIKGNIAWLKTETGDSAFWTDSNAHNWMATLSPDGDKFAYVSNRNGHSQIFVKDINSDAVRLVYANKAQHLALSKPIWNPQGTKLASARNDHVFIVDIVTNEVSHFDNLIGNPEVWYQNQSALFIRNDNQNTPKWIKYDFVSNSQQSIIFPKGHIGLLASSDQLMSTYQGKLYDQDDNILWTTPGNAKITQQISTASGVYLITENQLGGSERDVWRFEKENRSARFVTRIKDSAIDISDFIENMMIFSTYQVEKDIVSLSVN